MPGARLSVLEREEIALGLAQGLSQRAIAVELGRPSSTVSREVQRCGGTARYRCTVAQRLSLLRSRRPKERKLDAQPRLWRIVEQGLMRLWSPQQIAKRLRVDFPRDRRMRVSRTPTRVVVLTFVDFRRDVARATDVKRVLSAGSQMRDRLDGDLID